VGSTPIVSVLGESVGVGDREVCLVFIADRDAVRNPAVAAETNASNRSSVGPMFLAPRNK
jgi:hypothetical protein